MNNVELDAWIAKNLFSHGEYVGLVKNGFWYRPNAAGYTPNESEAGRYLIGEAIRHTTDPNLDDCVKVQSFSVPHYSTDPAAAMQALEKCCELLPGGVHIKKRDSGDWIVSKREDIDPVWEVAETLELAIARFAFKLYGGKE